MYAHPFSRSRSPIVRAFLAVGLLCAASTAHGQNTVTWLGGSNVSWATTGNWSSGTAPGSTTTVVYSSTSANLVGQLLGATRSVAGFTIGTVSGSVTIASGSSITIGSGGIDMSAATGDFVVSAVATLAGGTNTILNIASGRLFSLTSTPSTSGTFSLTGGGTVSIGGSGYTNINAGTLLQVGSGANLAIGGAAGTWAGTVTNNGGTVSTFGTQTVGRSGNGFFIQYSGSSSLVIGIANYDGNRTGSVTINGGTSTLNVTGMATTGFGSNQQANLTVNGGAVTLTALGNIATATNSVARITLSGGTTTLNAAFPSAALGSGASSTFTLDGGVYRAGASVTILQNLTNAYITSNGAFIDSNGFSTTIAQVLSDGTAPGTVGSLTKLSSGTLSLAGANTYSGTTFINAGVLQLGSSGTTGSLNPSSVISGSAGTTLAFNRTNAVTQGTDFSSGLAGPLNVTQLGTGTVTLSGSNSYTGVTRFNAGALAVGSTNALAGGGDLTFGGGSLQYTGSNQLDYSTRVVSSTSAVSVDTNGQSVTWAGPLAATNTGGFTKLGSGTLTLAGNNLYSGTTTVNGGVLLIGTGVASPFGTSSAIAVNTGGTLNYNSASTTVAVPLSGTGGVITPGSVGAASLTLSSTVGSSFGGSLQDGSGPLSVTRSAAAGTLQLTGSSSYTGATTVSLGTLQLSGTAGRIAGTSGVTVTSGTLLVGDTTAANNNGVTNRINPAAVLTLGGTLGAGSYSQYAPAASNTHSQSLAGLSLGIGRNAIAGINATGTNNLIFTGSSSSNYTKVTGGLVNLTTVAGFSTSFTNAVNGVAGVGSDAIVPGMTLNNTDLVGLSGGSSGTVQAATYTSSTSGWTAGKNMNVTANVTASGPTNVNSIRFNTGTTATATLTGANVIQSGMILMGSAVGSGTVNLLTITGGTMSSGYTSSSGVNELMIVNTRADDLRYTTAGFTIGSTIVDGTSPLALTVSGGGFVTLTGTSSYSGGTQLVNGGALIVGSDAALGKVPDSPATNIRAYGAGNLIEANAAPVTLDSRRTIELVNGAVLTLAGRNSSLTVPGSIIGTGTVGIPVGAAGAFGGGLVLTGTNTWSGALTVSYQNVRAIDGIGLPATANLIIGGGYRTNSAFETSGTFVRSIGTGAGQVSFVAGGNGAGGFAAVGGPLTVALGGTASPSTISLADIAGNFQFQAQSGNATNRMLVLNPIAIQSGSAFVIYANGASAALTADFAGVISGSSSGLSIGNGGWIDLSGANTYSGTTSIVGGNVRVYSINSTGAGRVAASSLGAPTNSTDGEIIVGGNGSSATSSSLVYLGNGETTDRRILMPSTNAAYSTTLDQSGSGLLNFTSGVALSATSKTLTLQGSTSGIGEISGPITQTTGTLTLTKAGTGIWRLSGTNTYTGLTTVSAGVLSISSTAALPGLAAGATNKYTVSAGAALVAGDNVSDADFNTLRTTGTFAANAAIGFDVGAAGRTYAGTGIANIGSGTALGFLKIGSGTLTMNVANTYTGTTTLREGTLRLGVAGALPANGALALTNGGLDMATSATAAAVSITGTGSIFGNSTLTGTSFTISNTTGTVVVSAPLAGAAATFTKSNAGTATLSGLSTFRGVTTVSGGVLVYTSIANSGTANASALGAPAAGANSIIALSNDATLRYTGTGGHSSDRTINLATASTGTATLEAAGSGAVTLGPVTAAASNSKTLLLTGTSASNNSIGAISNPSGAVTSLLKQGAGRWVLSGSSSYTGPTSVDQGELILGASAQNANTNGGLGANSSAPITIGNAAGSGTAALLLQAGVQVDSRTITVPTGSQLTVLGGANTTGTSTFGSAGSAAINFQRDIRLQAGTGGTVVFANIWSGSSGGSPTNNVTVGSAGNAGTVRINSSLGTTGNVNVDFGTLSVNGAIPNASLVSVAAGAVLAGSGTIGSNIGGDGLIAPGNSPGILQVNGQVVPTVNTSFAFELTQTGDPTWSSATASGNDVLRLTNANPFQSSLVSTNIVNVYFDVASLANGDIFNGGFYSDKTSGQLNFTSAIGAPTYAFFVYGDGSGSATSYNGKSFYSLAQYIAGNPAVTGVTTSVVTVPTANFANGTVTDGQVTQFVVVPEPATLALAAVGLGLGGWATLRRRRK